MNDPLNLINGGELAEVIDVPHLLRYFVRMILALVLGALLGLERASAGKEAGTRTHMLVTLAAAIFVLIPLSAGYDSTDMARIIQGVLAGMGFIGGGVIVKNTAEKEVIGITTAAGLWLATAIGIAAGLGRYGLAIMATILAFIILRLPEIHNSKPPANK